MNEILHDCKLVFINEFFYFFYILEKNYFKIREGFSTVKRVNKEIDHMHPPGIKVPCLKAAGWSFLTQPSLGQTTIVVFTFFF